MTVEGEWLDELERLEKNAHPVGWGLIEAQQPEAEKKDLLIHQLPDGGPAIASIYCDEPIDLITARLIVMSRNRLPVLLHLARLGLTAENRIQAMRRSLRQAEENMRKIKRNIKS